jgi:VWFA-related protein
MHMIISQGSKMTGKPAVAALALLLTASAHGQEPASIPSFPAQVEMVTVDVVVLDKSGQPIRGLTKDDFVVLEKGRPQTLASFEAFETRGQEANGGDVGSPLETRASTNQGPAGPRGRAFALVLDDLGLDPILSAPQVIQAIDKWLRERVDPADEVTLVTTSGDAWWSDIVGRGRDDLLAVLRRVRGKRLQIQASRLMNEWEAYQVTVNESPDPEVCSAQGTRTITRQVVDRWLASGQCLDDKLAHCMAMRICQVQVRAHAQQMDHATTRRLETLLGTVERLSKALAGWRGRKSILVFSEGFIQNLQQRAFASAIDASRRANTAVYCVDARGLSVTTPYHADMSSSAAPIPGDIGEAMAAALAATAGGEYLAEATGGLNITDTNDMLAGLDRVAVESSAYYLLGFQPETPRDGKWHPLEVKVSRRDVTLRARRGYLATPTTWFFTTVNERIERASVSGGRKKDGAKPGRPLEPAILAGGSQDGIPLRIAPHILGPDGSGSARVLVALEIDSRKLDFDSALTGHGAKRTTVLDLTLLAVSRDQPKVVVLDERLQADVDPTAVGGWWTLAREVSLPPGIAQMRAVVRDTATLLAGAITHRFEVPAIDSPYIGTPVLTDRALTSSDGTEAPRLVPVAHRSFPAEGLLYCQYEVFGAAAQAAGQASQLAGGYTLKDADGHEQRRQEPTPIVADADRRIRRLVTLPLTGLSPGRYELTLEVVDPATQLSLTTREPFVVETAVAN